MSEKDNRRTREVRAAADDVSKPYDAALSPKHANVVGYRARKRL